MNPNIVAQLRETASWCMHAISLPDLANSTRTPGICPDLLLDQDHHNQLESIHAKVDSLENAVSQICERRRRLLRQNHLKILSIEYCMTAGRLYATDFDTDVCEAPTDVSNGFFDESDIPGWDTWFAYQPGDHIQGVVFGWIPDEICAPVGRGIWAIPVDSVWWVNEIPENAR